MFTLFTTLALAADPIPFQRGAVPSAVETGAGQATVEIGTAIVDELLTNSDILYTDASATVALSDRVSVFGNAQLFQDFTGNDLLGPGTPRFGVVGGRVIAYQSRTLALAPWVSVDAGTQVLGEAGDEVGAQFGLAMHFEQKKFSLDVSAPLARIVFDPDPLDVEKSLVHTYSHLSFSTTLQVDEHHGLRAGMESFLPYVSYRYTAGRFSIEPVVGVPFVGLRAGARF